MRRGLRNKLMDIAEVLGKLSGEEHREALRFLVERTATLKGISMRHLCYELINEHREEKTDGTSL